MIFAGCTEKSARPLNCGGDQGAIGVLFAPIVFE